MSKTKRAKRRDALEVDLHGLKTTEAEGAILQAISDAHLRRLSRIALIHGYIRGTRLGEACQECLADLKAKGLIEGFVSSPGNPGETLVHL